MLQAEEQASLYAVAWLNTANGFWMASFQLVQGSDPDDRGVHVVE